MRRCLILACALALLPSLAFADEVLLKGGGKISGRILSRTDAAVQVDVGAGIITVPMASVLSIVEKRSILDEYEERAVRLKDNDAQGWLQLARWSLSEELGTQARRAYEHVIGIDPQNVEANQALGRVLLEGRWVPEQEVHRARGMVQFEGAWMMPAERDAILVERDARFNELLRLDAERRARDAELRVADAEARAQQATLDAAAGAVGGIPLWWGGSYVVGGYPSYPRYRRPPHGGRPLPPTPGKPWAPMGMYPSYPIGMYPSYPIGMWPSYPIGPAGSFPIGPAGSFPVGPSPPAGTVRPPAGGGRHQGGTRPSPPPSAKPSGSSKAGPPARGGGGGGATPRP
jgi:hypothetical protein